MIKLQESTQEQTKVDKSHQKGGTRSINELFTFPLSNADHGKNQVQVNTDYIQYRGELAQYKTLFKKAKKVRNKTFLAMTDKSTIPELQRMYDQISLNLTIPLGDKQKKRHQNTLAFAVYLGNMLEFKTTIDKQIPEWKKEIKNKYSNSKTNEAKERILEDYTSLLRLEPQKYEELTPLEQVKHYITIMELAALCEDPETVHNAIEIIQKLIGKKDI